MKFQFFFLAMLAGFTEGQVVNGAWGQWGTWTSCSVSCGSGTIGRMRFCDSPSPSGGGASCSGADTESVVCDISNYCLPSYYGNVNQSCSSNQFGCATGAVTCIDVSMRCDGTVDCNDGSDESHLFTGCDEEVCNQQSGAGMKGVSLTCILLPVLAFFWKQ